MQGVRTTRGCINCRRRKKGCDFRKPSCGRCQRTGESCAYEERKWMFVGQDLENPGQRRRSSGEGSSQAQSSMMAVSQTSLTATDTILLTEAGFWSIYLPQEDASLDGSIGGVLSAPWMSTARALAERDNNMRTAMHACAFAGLGWMRDDYTLVAQGTRLYTLALRQVNDALQDPEQVQSDELLACCRMLSIFEMFRRRDPSGQKQTLDWQKHVNGTCRLIQLRGPEKHVSGYGRDLYDAVRMTALIQGLAMRRSNAFLELGWGLPPNATSRDELFEIAGRIPELLHCGDELRARLSQPDVDISPQVLLRQGTQLLQRHLNMGQQLCDWEAETIQECRQKSQNPEDVTPEDGRQLADLCGLFGLGFFFICAQYWAFSMKMYSSIRLLWRDLDGFISRFELPRDKHLSELPAWTNPEPHALNIAQTAYIWFQPHAGLWSAQSSVFPLGHALFYYKYTGRRDSTPFKMIRDAFAESKTGSIMRDFVKNIVDA